MPTPSVVLKAFNQAATQGDLQAVQTLIRLHPDIVNAVDNKKGLGGLHKAIVNHHLDIVHAILLSPQLDLSRVSRKTPLLPLAISYNDPDTLLQLLKMLPGNNVNTAIGGQTLLMLGAIHGATDCMQLLLYNPGIEVLAVDAEGDTALTLAARGSLISDNYAIVQALLPHYHTVNDLRHQNSDGENAEQIAKKNIINSRGIFRLIEERIKAIAAGILVKNDDQQSASRQVDLPPSYYDIEPPPTYVSLESKATTDNRFFPKQQSDKVNEEKKSSSYEHLNDLELLSQAHKAGTDIYKVAQEAINRASNDSSKENLADRIIELIPDIKVREKAQAFFSEIKNHPNEQPSINNAQIINKKKP